MINYYTLYKINLFGLSDGQKGLENTKKWFIYEFISVICWRVSMYTSARTNVGDDTEDILVSAELAALAETAAFVKKCQILIV